MDPAEFETRLKQDGFQEISTRTFEPRPTNDEHAHDCTVRGLVTAGEFVVMCDGVARTYRAGDIFEVAAGVMHSETVGTGGATLTTGRLYPAQ
jgi:quercetin dioxygenase-like cupin family protein